MVTPTLQEVLREWLESRLLDVHTALPAIVRRYDADKQEVDVQPVVHQPVPLRSGGVANEVLPEINGVPVVWPRGGDCFLHFPLDPGDHVLLVFSEGSHASWYLANDSGKETRAPVDLRRHSLSSPFAIPGVATRRKPLQFPDGYGTPVVLKVKDILLVTNTGSPPAQFVAGGERVNDELNLLKGYLSTFVGVLNTWLATFGADSATLAPVAPTMQPGAAAVLTAAGTLAGQLSSWPSATVEVGALKSE